jgi:hypothetical protein
LNEEYWAWGSDELRLHFAHGEDTAPRLLALTAAGESVDTAALRRSALPVLEIALAGDGRHGTAGKRHVDGAAAQRMRLAGEESSRDGELVRLRLDLVHPGDGLEARVYYEIAAGIRAVRSWAEITATRCDVVVEFASSFAISGLGHGSRWEEDFALWRAANPWSGEFRWRRLSLGDEGLYDVGMTAYGQVGSKNRITATSVSAWSTSEALPMGVLEDLRSGRMLAWQIEHSGAWHWELGDRYDDVYLVASGPTEAEHQCTVRLKPGESFRTAAATVAPADGLDDLGAAFTQHRRRIRRKHLDHAELPIVYNDFLNALMADPTTERVRPLIAAAADLGAEIYCIDAGWYDDEDGGWWDAVGEWSPSSKRFPDGGLSVRLQHRHRLRNRSRRRLRPAGTRPRPSRLGARRTRPPSGPDHRGMFRRRQPHRRRDRGRVPRAITDGSAGLPEDAPDRRGGPARHRTRAGRRMGVRRRDHDRRGAGLLDGDQPAHPDPPRRPDRHARSTSAWSRPRGAERVSGDPAGHSGRYSLVADRIARLAGRVDHLGAALGR